MVAKAHQPSSSESDDWGDEGWTVACPCGVTYDDGEMMVECEECGVWVHTACCRVVKDLETFNCDKCKSKKNKEFEESEVAQLLVDLPSKPVSFEERGGGHDRAAPAFSAGASPAAASAPPAPPVVHLDPVRSPNRDRAHVQGIPGGDPRLFVAGSIFSRQLWKATGYVRKPVRIDFTELPGSRSHGDIERLLDDASSDELAVLVLMENASKGEGRPPAGDRDVGVADLAAAAPKLAKKAERHGKHNKLKLKHKHRNAREEKHRQHEKRPRDQSGHVQEVVSKKKARCSTAGDAARAEDERRKKVEGLFHPANFSPTYPEGSVQEVVNASVKKVEDASLAPSPDANLLFKSPQSPAKNPKAMKKLAVQEFMDGGITTCSKCCREEPILGRTLAFSGAGPNTLVCRDCESDTSAVPCGVLSMNNDHEAAQLCSAPASESECEQMQTCAREGSLSEKEDGELVKGPVNADDPCRVKDQHFKAKKARVPERQETQLLSGEGDLLPEQTLDSSIEVKTLQGSANHNRGLKSSASPSKDAVEEVIHSHVDQHALSHDFSNHQRLVVRQARLSSSVSAKCEIIGLAGTEKTASVLVPVDCISQSRSLVSSRVLSSENRLEDCEDKKEDGENDQDAGLSRTNSSSCGLGVAGDMLSVRKDEWSKQTTPSDLTKGSAGSSYPGDPVPQDNCAPCADVALQQHVVEDAVLGRMDASADGRSSMVSPSSSADGKTVRSLSHPLPVMREKAVNANLLSSGASVPDRPQVDPVMVLLRVLQSGAEPLLQSPKISLGEDGTGKQQLSSSQQQGERHVHTPKVQHKNNSLVSDIRASTVEIGDSVVSPSHPKASDHALHTGTSDQKVSPSQSPVCQQARQHHLHPGRGRTGASLVVDRSSSIPQAGGGLRMPSAASLSTAKPGSLKSPGGALTVSPKSPPIPLQPLKQGGSKASSSSPPLQRPGSGASVTRTPHASSSKHSSSSSASALARQHSLAPKASILVSSSSLPNKTSSSKQPSRTNSLPSLKPADSSLPPAKSPAATSPASRGGMSQASVKHPLIPSKVATPGKLGGTPRHPSSGKGPLPHTFKQPGSQSSARQHASDPAKSTTPMSTKHSASQLPKQPLGVHKDDKSAMPSAPPFSKGMSAMPPPPPPTSLKRSPPAAGPTGSAATLKDEEIAMLLHQELNSSPRVPRGSRARQANAGMQGGSSTQAPVVSTKRQTASAVHNTQQIGDRDVPSRKRPREDRHRDGGRGMTGASEELSKSGATTRKHEDGNRADDRYHVSEKSSGGALVESGSFKEKSSNVESNPRRSSHGFLKGNLSIVVPARSDESSEPGDRKSPADSTILTLPGLIDDILSKRGHQLSYEDVCEAVGPHWQKLRKPNGDRYAYASHRQAVLDCLRNRSSWAHLVDRGPKTNLGRKRRRNDIAVATESDEDDDMDGSTPLHMEDDETLRSGIHTAQEKLQGEQTDRQMGLEVALLEDVPKGKRKARSRRCQPLSTEETGVEHNGGAIRAKIGSTRNSGRDKASGPGQDEEADVSSSPSSEEAVSNYSEEDEEMVVHKGMRGRRRRDGESSGGEDDLD